MEEEDEAEDGEMMPVDDRDLRLTIRNRNDDGAANGSSSRQVFNSEKCLISCQFAVNFRVLFNVDKVGFKRAVAVLLI